jgi:hypothetical protein
MTRKNTSQPREDVVVLGDQGYNNAVKAMIDSIAGLPRCIDSWNATLVKLGGPVQGESPMVTESRQEHVDLVAKATREIEQAEALYDEVTKHRTTPDQRVIGFVLHSEKIEVSVDPHGFTKDWALVELYEEKIDWASFKGNKVYVGTSFPYLCLHLVSISRPLHLWSRFPSPVFLSSVLADYYFLSSAGGNLSILDFASKMFPQPADQGDYNYPLDGLLQAHGVVPDEEIRNPQHLDVHGEKCLFVVKNGLATGTTVGRTNGLESFTRTIDEYGIKQTSVEIAVLPYDKKHGAFSDAGDSGSIVLARDGRIVGILTGGAGPTDGTDITYLTPYWWVEKEIKAKYPGCFLYQEVQ